ncbi:MAG: GtrA family protein [Candidatus Omnitrophica bacterium]|nr:GtrA family protein [Candidatus Omnitrophota bacterium]
MTEKKKSTKKELILFLIAGTIINTTDFSIYYILFHFFPFSVSKAISFTLAGTLGYVLFKYWIFKNKKQSVSEIGRYAIINFSALGVNVFTNQVILNLFPGSIWTALVIASGLTGVFTYVCFKWWVFRASPAEML